MTNIEILREMCPKEYSVIPYLPHIMRLSNRKYCIYGSFRQIKSTIKLVKDGLIVFTRNTTTST